jgi:periplasmic divalent cation tolerance protein
VATATEVVQVQFTASSKELADRIAGTLLDRRLVACAQSIGPLESRYWWQGELESAREWLVLCKTTAARVDDTVAAVVAGHDYEVPEVLVTPVHGGSAAYLAWVADAVRG